MSSRNTPAGAMPVAEGATPFQSYPFGPAWAPYRLPFLRLNAVVTPRELGIGFEGEPAGGANPPPASTNPPAGAGSGASTEGDAGSSATDDAKLGEGGKRAIEAERTARKVAEDRAKAAEKERDDLKLATASESEKALAAARQEGKAEVTERLHASVRRTAVREALLTAGAIPSLVSDLSKADEFAALKVNDGDEIDSKELAEAVKAHKARVKDAYKAPGDAGDADGGARGGGKPPAQDLTSALERHYAPSQG